MIYNKYSYIFGFNQTIIRGLVKPKLVEAFIVNHNANFNILKQFNCVLVGQIKNLITPKCRVQLSKLSKPNRQNCVPLMMVRLNRNM